MKMTTEESKKVLNQFLDEVKNMTEGEDFRIQTIDSGKIKVIQIIVEEKTKEQIKDKNIQQLKTKKDYEKEVTEIMKKVGIPAHIKGYNYIRQAIIMTLDDVKAIDFITKTLYPTIAQNNNTTSSRVERAMRHAIELAWSRGNIEYIQDIFGYSISDSKGRPTNSQFIASIVDYILQNVM